MEINVLQSIRDWLRREGVAFREVQHGPTFTSEESAKARGEDVRVGGKAILMKTDQAFRLFVLSAALKYLTFTNDPIASSLSADAQHAVAVGLLKPVNLNGIYDLGPLNKLLTAAGQPQVSS